MARKRKRLTNIRLNEISGVDSPAQEGALALIVKRDGGKPMGGDEDDEDDEEMEMREDEKRKTKSAEPDFSKASTRLSAALNRRIDQMTSDSVSRADIVQRMAGAAGIDEGTVNQILNGSIAVPPERRLRGFARVLGMSASTLISLAGGKTEEKMAKTDIDKATDVGVLEEQLRVAKALAELTDAQKAHYAKLDEEDKAGFLGKSADEREEVVEKAEEADPIVYTSPIDGTVFRKSDDPRLRAAVKRGDDAEIRTQKLEAKDEAREFEKRANAELPNLPGKPSVRGAILKALEGIDNEDVRKAALESVAAGDKAISAGYADQGFEKSDTILSAEQELQKRADKLATSEEITPQQAYARVMSTPEGKALYQKTLTPASAD